MVCVIDPTHGGEVLDLIGADGGRPLGRPPFAPLAALVGDLDEDAWTDRYRGGWQLAAPNAGNRSRVQGVDHGFHGAVATRAWTVETQSVDAAALSVVVHGLRYERGYRLAGGRLRVETRVAAVADTQPMIAVEHVVCGASVLDPAVRLSIAPGRAYELSETTGPLTPPADASAFPQVLLAGGGREDASTWPVATPRGRFFVVADLPEGFAQAENVRTGERLVLRWDADVLGHLWVWHECRASGGRWREQAELLGIEPSMCPHSLGLADAIGSGHARLVRPGRPVSWWVEAEPVGPTRA